MVGILHPKLAYANSAHPTVLLKHCFVHTITIDL